MANYTMGVCTYELTADETGQNTSLSRVPWDQVASGFTELNGITMDFVTNKGTLQLAANCTSFWDSLMFKAMVQPKSLAAAAGVRVNVQNVTDAVTWMRGQPLHASSRTDTGSHGQSPWIPAANSKDLELQVRSQSDTSWSVAARETYAYSWLQVIGLKAL
jgi:hypothetical protein